MFPFNRVLANVRGYGRFSSPLRNSEDLTLYHSSGDTPSVTPIRACQLPQGGSRDGVRTIQRAAQKPQRCGRFSSPLRKAFSIHRGTLPQSRIRSTAPSEREPGMAAPFIGVLANIRGYGRFSSPLRRAGAIHRGRFTPLRRGMRWGGIGARCGFGLRGWGR